jgi:hypothetical protein
MRGPDVVFNCFASLYFEIESTGGDDLSLPIRSPIDQLALVKSSGRPGFPHKEGACLSRSLHTQNETEARSFSGMIVHLSC